MSSDVFDGITLDYLSALQISLKYAINIMKDDAGLIHQTILLVESWL